MGKGLREKAVMATLGMVVLYAIAVGTWFLSAQSEWKKASAKYGKARQAYQNEVRLIGEKKKWTDAYEAEKAQMPSFGLGKQTVTTWQRKLNKIAEKHHFLISKAQAGTETQADDVLELPIEVRGEGCLEALVRLMHELENTEEGMFDITQISFSPMSKQGYLRGDFTLSCAYIREEE